MGASFRRLYTRDAPASRECMTDEYEFRAARRLRKKRQEWWRGHMPLAYVLVGGIFLVVFLVSTILVRGLPSILTAFGMTPSGVNFVLGAIFCALGVWGLRRWNILGIGWAVAFTLCLVGGVMTLLKAF